MAWGVAIKGHMALGGSSSAMQHHCRSSHPLGRRMMKPWALAAVAAAVTSSSVAPASRSARRLFQAHGLSCVQRLRLQWGAGSGSGSGSGRATAPTRLAACNVGEDGSVEQGGLLADQRNLQDRRKAGIRARLWGAGRSGGRCLAACTLRRLCRSQRRCPLVHQRQATAGSRSSGGQLTWLRSQRSCRVLMLWPSSKTCRCCAGGSEVGSLGCSYCTRHAFQKSA